MIALDASVLIALLDENDRHHDNARRLLRDAADDGLTIGPVTLAEVLIGATAVGRQDQALATIRAVGVSVTHFPDDAAQRLAHLRVKTRLRMPDCSVLLTADQTGARVATFDDALRRAAIAQGFVVLP